MPEPSEPSSQDEAAAKLVEAIRAVVGGPAGDPTAKAAAKPPGFWNVFFLLLMIVNLYLTVALAPPDLLEQIHWDVLKEIVPLVGGSFLVLTASWYQEATLAMFRSKVFRAINVGCFVGILAVAILPWAHLRPEISPAEDAKYYLYDDPKKEISGEDRLSSARPMWVSIKPHTFQVNWGGQDAVSKTRSFKLKSRTLLAAVFGHPPAWHRLHKLAIGCKTAPCTEIDIAPNLWEIDDDFLEMDKLAEWGLTVDDVRRTIKLKLPEGDQSLVTYLPVGPYTMTPRTASCVGKARYFTVDEKKGVMPADGIQLEDPVCTH